MTPTGSSPCLTEFYMTVIFVREPFQREVGFSMPL